MATKAQKLLEDMRNSEANWKRRDLERLYSGFGFIIRHGGSHDIVVHPKYKQLRTTLPRHNEVLKTYVKIAVRMVDKLLELQKEAQDEQESKAKGGDAG
jgi:predicted RNA binding protein YcfA (HicA-like mRNA interferase family)